MQIKYPEGKCSGCGKSTLITHKSKKLGECCRKKSTQSKSVIVPKPKKVIEKKVTLKNRTPLKRSTKAIPRQSSAGKIKKKIEIDYYKSSWEAAEDWKGGCVCEECKIYLPSYSSVYISHILTRGAHPKLALHPKNHNILCGKHHTQWETGDRKSMGIYEKNLIVIEQLLEAEKNSVS